MIYEYASKYPNKVRSLTFLDVSPNGIEFYIPSVLNNWTEKQTNEYKQIQLSGRYAIFGIINTLGVPWGLMSIFIPVSPPVSEFDGFLRWNFLTEKTWITQGLHFLL